jgi:hypothetical protein
MTLPQEFWKRQLPTTLKISRVAASSVASGTDRRNASEFGEQRCEFREREQPCRWNTGNDGPGQRRRRAQCFAYHCAARNISAPRRVRAGPAAIDLRETFFHEEFM